jgi:hypothetical protein
MEYRFKAEDWENLGKQEQIRRCTLMADEATALAHAAPPNMKEAYLELAGQWLALAAEIAKSLEESG